MISHYRAYLQPTTGAMVEVRFRVAPRAPVDTGLHEIAQPVEDLEQIVLALQGVLAQQCQIRGDKRLFLVAHIGGVWRAWCGWGHPAECYAELRRGGAAGRLAGADDEHD